MDTSRGKIIVEHLSDVRKFIDYTTSKDDE